MPFFRIIFVFIFVMTAGAYLYGQTDSVVQLPVPVDSIELPVLPDTTGQEVPLIDSAGQVGVPADSTRPVPPPQRPVDFFAKPERDTNAIFYFFADNPNAEIPFSDTLLQHFHQYDPTRQQQFDHIQLGNLGSAHQPMVYTPRFRNGFDAGFHQFDLYQITAAQLPFYRMQKALTDLTYSMGSEQADGYLTAKFARNFSDGLHLSLEHRRISQLGETYQFVNQNTRDIAFGIGLWYQSPTDRYNAFLTFSNNVLRQENNGGIVAETNVDRPFEEPVYLSSSNSAQTRYDHNELLFTHYLRFGGKSDSTRTSRRAFTLGHSAAYQTNRYKFYDASLATDSSYYAHFQVDNRGLRNFIRVSKVENHFKLNTFLLRKNTRSTEIKQQKDFLEIGLRHALFHIEDEPQDSSLNNLFLTGRWEFSPSQRLQIKTYAHFGLWDHAGNYRVHGQFAFDFDKLGKLTLEATQQLYSPSLIQHRFYISQRLFWKNHFVNTLETSLSATYALSDWKTEVGGHYHLINNLVYFDTFGLAQQTGVPQSIFQLFIKKDFKVGRFFFDNQLAFQKLTEEDFLRLPAFSSKHSIYYEGSLFENALHLKMGFDARMNSSYYADYYQGLTGQFHLQNAREVLFYPSVDLFVSFKVQSFRAFFKFDNVTNWMGDVQLADWFGQKYYYLATGYPQPNSLIRFGIGWRFED